MPVQRDVVVLQALRTEAVELLNNFLVDLICSQSSHVASNTTESYTLKAGVEVLCDHEVEVAVYAVDWAKGTCLLHRWPLHRCHTLNSSLLILLGQSTLELRVIRATDLRNALSNLELNSRRIEALVECVVDRF